MKRPLTIAALVFGGILSATAQERMPPIPPDKMTDAQKKAAAAYKDMRGTEIKGGPWGVLLRVPDYEVPAVMMRQHNQKNSVLGPKLTEFAILIAARHWSNSYEFNAHMPVAEMDGLSKSIIAAIIDGRRPENMADDEEMVYNFCDELLHNQSVTDPTYARIVAKFGEPGAVETAALQGYYTFLAMVMNVARTPVNPGTPKILTPFPK